MAPPVGGGRIRRVVIRTVIVLVVGAALLAPILYYASTVDVRPPQVDRFVLTQHLPGDDGVALTTASLEVVFSEAVERVGAQAAFTIAPRINGSFSWSGSTMVFTPTDRLPLETTFSVRLRGPVRDLAGNAMGGAGPFAFRTVGGPTIVTSQPADQATDVPLDVHPQLTFSTFMDTASVQRALQLIPRTDVELRWSGQRVVIIPRALLQPGQQYQVLLGSGAADQAGTPISNSLRLSFTTISPGLHLRTVVPADGTQGIAVTSPIAIVFDRAINPDSVSDSVLTVSPSVSGSLGLTSLEGAAGLEDKTARVLRFTPSGALPANTTFTISLGAGIRGDDGARLAAPVAWTFTTGAPSSSVGNQIVFLSARSGVANLWAMNPDGSNQHQISAELSAVTSYAVAPDGRSLVVGDGARLVEQSADGSGRRVLTEGGLIEFDASYAPDGSSIVFGRADASTGSGLGIWRRPPGGGSPERIAITQTSTPTPSPSIGPSVSPAASEPRVPLLRSPRYSPDGNQIAFVDMSGRAGIIELRSGSATTVPYRAASPPVWLPSGSGVLVSGLIVSDGGGLGGGLTGPGGLLTPGTAVPPLTPAGLRLSPAERASLAISELSIGNTQIRTSLLHDGATLPDVDPQGRIAYLVLDPRLPDAGRVWIANRTSFVSTQVVPDARALESSVRFAPEPETLVVGRTALPAATPSSSPGASSSPSQSTPSPTPTLGSPPSPPETTSGPGGIWLVHTVSGKTTQLSPDGWLPAWLP